MKTKTGIVSLKSAILYALLLFFGTALYADVIGDGNIAYLKHEWSTATAMYSRADKDTPDRPEIPLNIGNVLYQQAVGNMENSGSQLQSQVQGGLITDPNQFQQQAGQIKEELANALSSAQEKYIEAEERANTVIMQDDPDYAREMVAAARANTGNCYYKLQELEKAIENFKEALRINPQDDDAKYNLYRLKQLLEAQKNQQQQNQCQNPDENQDNQDQNQDQQQQNQQPQEADNQENQEQAQEIPYEELSDRQKDNYLRSALEREQSNRQDNQRKLMENQRTRPNTENDY